MVKNDQIGFVRCNLSRHFLNLTLAGKRCCIGTLAPAMHDTAYRRSGRQGQQTNFFQLLSYIVVTKIKLNDDRTLTCGGSLKHVYISRMTKVLPAENRNNNPKENMPSDQSN